VKQGPEAPVCLVLILYLVLILLPYSLISYRPSSLVHGVWCIVYDLLHTKIV
jgi:hypothetical protein